jgi:hypothetical protein
MKKLYKITLSLAVCLLSLITEAQTVVTIPAANTAGTGASTTIHRKPFGTNRSYERTALKYTNNEIGMLGNITAIGFYCDTINNPGKTPVKIYLKEVPDSTFTAGTVAAEEAGATLVYADTIFPASFLKNSWVTVNLTTIFPHLTTSNIKVIIETNSTGNNGTDLTTLSKGFRYSPVSGSRMEYWQNPANNNVPPAGNGTLAGTNRSNIQFTIAPAASCTAPPTAGTTIATATTVCSGNTVGFSLSGTSTGIGLTYQWISSPNGTAWSNIGGATGTAYTATVSAVTYYACVVTCSAQNDTSTRIQINLNPFYQCYCTAGIGGGCTAASAIDTLAITGTTLYNGPLTCPAGNYIAYPPSGNTTASVTQGQTYALRTTFGGSVIASVWIDYNRDGVFGTSEWKQICTTSTANVPVTTNITIPFTSLSGQMGMRIRTRGGSTNDSTSACTAFGSGETQDYVLTIIAASPCTAPPTAGTTVATQTTVCSGSTVTLSLSGNSAGSGQTYQWISSPDGTTWSTIGGAINSVYTATVSAVTYYACVLTCSAQNDTSTQMQININPFYNCYCTTGIGGGCTAASAIDTISITGTTLYNGPLTCPAGNYIAYPASGNTTASVTQGQTYALNTTFGGSVIASVWIDYNHDGVYGTNEWKQICTTSAANVPVITNLLIPFTSLAGQTGMRIRTRGGSVNDSTSACTAFGSGETQDYIITIIAASPCTAPPTAGTTTATQTSVCSGSTVNLSLSGNSTGSGQTYQWLSSPDGSTWSLIAGATSPIYSTTVSAVTYFSCVLTCSSQSDTSLALQININPFYNCYCTSGIGGGCTAATVIDSVNISGTTLDNGPLTCPAGNYIAYPAAGNTTASVIQGQSYTLNTKFGGSVIASLWIDYNRNGTFETTEWQQICTTATVSVNVATNILIPMTALTGQTGLRIRTRTTGNPNDSTSACTAFGSGETQDYIITIAAPTPCTSPPVAGTTIATPTAVCSGDTVNLSLNGNSLGVGQTYQWQSSPDGSTWTPIGGATLTVYTATVSAVTYFSCVLTCSSQSSASSSVQINLNPFYNCYCTAAIGGGCTTTAIDSVAISATTLDNGPTGCSAGNYTMYPASGNTTATLLLGTTYTLNAVFTGTVNCSMWIDYNQNGMFDSTEWTQVCTTSTAMANTSAVFTVPLGALPGITGMRLRTNATPSVNDSSNSCTNFTNGETEDYILTLASNTTGLKQTNASQLYVFPNPSSGIVTIGLNINCAGKINYQVVNVAGETVYTEQSSSPLAGTITKQLNLTSLTKGIYFIRVVTDKEIVMKKIVLQ